MNDPHGAGDRLILPPGMPIIDFPPRLVDSRGHRVRPGCTVRLLDGRTGEVTTWTSATCVQVAIDDVDETDYDLESEFIVEIEAGELTVVPFERRSALALGVRPVEFTGGTDHRRVVLVHPVGGQDVVTRPRSDGAVLPAATGFMSRRGPDRRRDSTGADPRQEKLDARRFGEACIATLADVENTERSAIVAAEIDAPMLRRALEETVLPEMVRRLVLVATDQDDERFNVDDTAAFAELLELWVRGTAATRMRQVDEIDIVRIRRSPHRIDFVLDQVSEHLARLSVDADELVVVQAGGTPSMTFGVLLGAIRELDVPVRHVQIPLAQPVVEIDVLTR